MKRITAYAHLFRIKRFFILGAALFLLALPNAAAADISLDKLEMASRGAVDNGEFGLSSVISADLALRGGYKYTFLLGFSLDAADLTNTLADRLNNQNALHFRIAKATVRNLFNLPLEMSYFIGSNDDFCTGDEFSTRYGLAPFATGFRGFFYFPGGIGGNPGRRYNGIYSVQGTGFSLGLTKWDNFIPMLYLYQDFGSFSGMLSTDKGALTTDTLDNSGKNLYSGDLRFLIYHNWLRLEVFGGASINTDLDASFRGGLMAHLAAQEGVEFFAQAGIPGWNRGEKFGIDNIFFLIEPRLHLGVFGVYVTFFYHPRVYNHIITEEEKGRANINIKFLFGNVESGFAGGIETGADLKVDGSEHFILRVAPFGTFISGGMQWDAKIQIKPLDHSVPIEMFEVFIGVKTAF